MGIRLGSGAGPAREAALTAALRSDDGALDRRKDLAAAAAAISAAGVGEWILRFLVLCVRAAVSVAMRAGVYSRETATWAQQRQLARAPRVR